MRLREAPGREILVYVSGSFVRALVARLLSFKVDATSRGGVF